MRIDHVGVQVPDLAAALELFVERLGGELRFKGTGPEGTTPVAFVDLGGTSFEIFERGDGPARLEHLALGADDVSAAATELRARGVLPAGGEVEVLEGTQGTRAVLLDPESTLGIRMHLISPAPGAEA